MSSAAKSLEDEDYTDCWDLLVPRPAKPAPKKPKKPKKNNVYKMNSAHVTIGEHTAQSYTYPIAITDRSPSLVDSRIRIEGYEYQIIRVEMEHRTPMDFGYVSRGGPNHGDEITIRARRI